jgi:hypothetical protein
MSTWLAQLLTLAGVAVGAVASFVSTRSLERSRWYRDEAVRWASRRMDSYGDFARAIKLHITIAQRIAAGLGLPATGQPLDPVTGSQDLAIADDETSVKWEQILMLGNPDAIAAAREWRHAAWHLEAFARGLRNDPAEYKQTVQESGEARRKFYAAVRADLGITSGQIPDVDSPPAWLQIARTDSSPAAS